MIICGSYIHTTTHPHIVRVFDGGGQKSQKTVNQNFFIIFVYSVDTTPPVIACTNNVNTNVNLGQAGTTVSWVEPTATDNSGTANLASQTHQPGTFFPLGTTTVTYRFVDASGNSATCSFDVTVTPSKWMILWGTQVKNVYKTL